MAFSGAESSGKALEMLSDEKLLLSSWPVANDVSVTQM